MSHGSGLALAYGLSAHGACWLTPEDLRHGSEFCVHVGIVSAEPVAEARTYQFSRGCRRRAFDHVVLAVEELGRVLGIGRHRGEAGKRTEDGRRPFPPVADQIVHTPGTRRKRADGHRLEAGKIEMTPRRCGSVTLVTRWISVGGAMELGFGHQTTTFPPRVSARFRLAHVDGPVSRQRDLFE